MNTLFLRLEGPLQSWGIRANWGERDTGFEPTKSAVIGLLGCVLGLGRADQRLRVLSTALRMGVRVDRQGELLTDYHTTGGARCADGQPEGMLSADGKLKRETDVSHRRYLMDASFLVALHGAEAIIGELAEALASPCWPIFLGRKSCVPSVPVDAGTGDYANVLDALRDGAAAEPRALAERADPLIRLVLEGAPGQGVVRYDAIGMPERRLFLPRYVVEQLLPESVFAHEAAINTLEG